MLKNEALLKKINGFLGKRSSLKDDLPSPISQEKLSQSVLALGFEPPAILSEVYMTIANGGFGPGYELMGLIDGHTDDLGNTCIDLYKSFSESNPDDPAWIWPQNLLPICHWGCAIYSCIDCSTQTANMFVWDPNMWAAGDPRKAIRPVGRDLSSWLSAWTDGVNLWDEMYDVKALTE